MSQILAPSQTARNKNSSSALVSLLPGS